MADEPTLSGQKSIGAKLRELSKTVPNGFVKHVINAAEISESGRWSKFNEAVTALANSGVREPWKLQVVAGLAAKSFVEVSRLESNASAHAADGASITAWSARNLLELSVWSQFASKSDENLRVIFDDAGRDANELFNKIKELLSESEASASWVRDVEEGQQELKARAILQGVPDTDATYMRVGKAAGSLGVTKAFNFHHKFLSKFAHPTAMTIVGISDANREALQKGYFM